MAETAERAAPRGMKISIISFISSTSEAAKPMTVGNKNYPHEIIMSRRKSRNSRKGCAEGDEDFLYFFYFCGTIKYFPHEIIIVPQKWQKGQKGLRRVRVTRFPLFLLFLRDNKKLSA